MRRNIGLRSLVVLLAFCMVFGVVESARAQSPEADVFAVIKVSNPQELIPSIAQFIDKFQPGMGAMADPMMIGDQVFSNPEWVGMDMAGEYTAVLLNPMKYPQNPVALVVPLTNKDEYLGVLSEMLAGGEEMEGIHTFTRPDQRSFFLSFAGDKGIITESQDVSMQVKALIDGDSQLLKEVPVVKGQVTAFISVNKVLMTVRPMIEMFKQSLLMGMQQGMPQGEGEGVQPPPPEGAQPPPGVQNILLAEIDMLLSILDQTEKLQLGVGLEADGVRLSKAVFAVSGSNLEKFMAAQTPKKSSLLGFIPEDSGIMGSASLNTTPEFVDGYVAFVKMMSTLDPTTDEARAEQIVGWVKQGLEVFNGAEYAFGAMSQTEEGLAFGVNQVKDGAKAKELIAQYEEMFQTMTTGFKDMGIELNVTLVDRSEFKGGEIFNYDFGFNAEMIPDPEGREMFNKLFGESIAFPIGVLGNYQVIGFGKGSRGLVEKIMEQLDSGAEVSAKYTPAMFGLPEENNMFVYMSLPKLAIWVAKYAPEGPKFELVESPGLGMAGTFVDSHFEGEMFLPVGEIQALQEMGQQVAPGAPPEAPEAPQP